jgi:hypothetical protein
MRVFRTHRDRGHASGLQAALNHGDNLFALLIAQRKLRAKQVGSANVAAAKVSAMAGAARDSINGLAAFHLCGIFGRALLSGYKASGGAWGLWRLCESRKTDQ